MRAFLLYGLLVGVPVAGTLAVLESGANLRAAPAVSGSWTIEAGPAEAGCAAERPLQSFVIVQSGPVITITLPDAGSQELSGKIHWEGDTLPRLEAKAADHASASPATLRDLSATLVKVDDNRSLEGTLRIAACGTVREQPFRAAPTQRAPARPDGND